MESKAIVKLTNDIVASRFFARTPSRILRIVKICEVVDLFLRKPFWFFLNMWSILGSMRFRSKALYILAAIDVSSVVLGLSEVALFREEEDASLHPSVYRILIIYGITVSEQYVVEFSGLPHFWGYLIKPYCFLIFDFSYYRVKFFLSIRS